MSIATGARPVQSAPDSYWTADVTVFDINASARRCVVAMGDPTLESALAKAISDALYYLSIGYTQARIEAITCTCTKCYGDGKTQSRRNGPMVRCKACKGVGVYQTLGTIPVDIKPDNGITITNARI